MLVKALCCKIRLYEKFMMDTTKNETPSESVVFKQQDPTEVLSVTPDGKFHWHQDADKIIAETDWTHNPAMLHILRILRKACAAGLTSE